MGLSMNTNRTELYSNENYYNKKYMKKLLLLFVVVLMGCPRTLPKIFPDRKHYKVKVTFCDSRAPVVVDYYGCNCGINNGAIRNDHYVAVPEWNGLLNVCNIEEVK